MRGDAAISAIVASIMLVASAVGIAASVFVVAQIAQPEPPAPIAAWISSACGTVGRWSAAELVLVASTLPFEPSDITIHDGTTGASTSASTDPLTMHAPTSFVMAGDTVRIVTGADRASDIDCEGAALFTYTADNYNSVLSRAPYVAANTPALVEIGSEACTIASSRTTYTFTFERVPPDWKPSELRFVDQRTGASTEGGGPGTLSFTGGSHPNLLAGDTITVRTRANEASRMLCGDQLSFVDTVSGSTIHVATLPS